MKSWTFSNSSAVICSGRMCSTPLFWIPVSIISEVYCGRDRSQNACTTNSTKISNTELQ